MRTFLVSYATPNFAEVRRALNVSAIQFGIGNILSYAEADLKQTAFYRDNRALLDAVCGAGYWAWKPYFTRQALELLEEGDILMYCDAGTAIIAPPDPLIQICRSNSSGLVIFDARPLTNRQFTKRDCFVRLNCDTADHWDATKVIAGLLLVRKSARTIAFIDEWLAHCQDPAAISDEENRCGLPDLEGFLVHRHDQAILSLLVSKHRIETYRNPTVWGNFLKLPQFRVAGERVVSPYGLIPGINDYAREPQANSPYGTIFDINRQPNFVGKPLIPASIVPTAPVTGPAISTEESSGARPFFSIICPTYNVREKIVRTLESILSQEGVELECIVADAGSTDGTSEEAERFFSDARLRYDSRPDRGIYDGMNRGINLARGRFLYFIGAGDRLRPNMLAAVAKEIERARIDSPALVYGDVYWQEYNKVYDGPFNRFHLATRNICQQAIFYHRSTFDLLGHFDLRYRTHADYAFNLRCFNSRRVVKRYLPIIIADYEGGGASAPGWDPQFGKDFAWLVRQQLGVPAALYHRYRHHGLTDVRRAIVRGLRRLGK